MRRDLEKQLFDPDHCHVASAAGLLRHPKGDELAGLPIRFTRLAAESVVRELRSFGVGSAVVLGYTLSR